MMKGIDYPSSKKTDRTDDYHGTIVADPYRWLEDVDSTETLESVSYTHLTLPTTPYV